MFDANDKSIIKVVEEFDSDGAHLKRYEKSNGDFEYRNTSGELHRTGGPAKSLYNGTRRLYYQNGFYSRRDGPAVEDDQRSSEYWIDGCNFDHVGFLLRTKNLSATEAIMFLRAPEGWAPDNLSKIIDIMVESGMSLDDVDVVLENMELSRGF